MENTHYKGSMCPIPGEEKGQDPEIGRTDEKAHTELHVLLFLGS